MLALGEVRLTGVVDFGARWEMTRSLGTARRSLADGGHTHEKADNRSRSARVTNRADRSREAQQPEFFSTFPICAFKCLPARKINKYVCVWLLCDMDPCI